VNSEFPHVHAFRPPARVSEIWGASYRQNRSIIRKIYNAPGWRPKQTVLSILQNRLSSGMLAVHEGTSADIGLKGVATWVYKLSAAVINGGVAYIRNTE